MTKRVAFAPGWQRWRWSHLMLRPWLLVLYAGQECKWFVQRGWRGYADCDCWSIDSYVANILVPMLTWLRDNHHGMPMARDGRVDERGHPIALTSLEWVTILDRMVEGFEATQRITKMDYETVDTLAMLLATQQLGLEEFVRWYDALWD